MKYKWSPPINIEEANVRSLETLIATLEADLRHVTASYIKVSNELAALKAQIPVAVVASDPTGFFGALTLSLPLGTKLYARPVSTTPQEPVAWLYRDADTGEPCDASLSKEEWKKQFTFSPLYARPAPAKVPDGWKLLQDSSQEQRSWVDDYAHENGAYFNTCAHCLRTFIGHKRRVFCQFCNDNAPELQPAPEYKGEKE